MSISWLRANIPEIMAELASLRAAVHDDVLPTEDAHLRELVSGLTYARKSAKTVLAAHYEKRPRRLAARMQTRRHQ